MALDTLREIERWYAAHCDGDWEHTYGVDIQTLDNPGWRVHIDLHETSLAAVPFESVRYGDPEGGSDWLHLSVVDYQFRGVGDASKLAVILEAFLDWVRSHDAA